MKAEDHELFLNVGQMCIAQGDSAQLLDFISDEKNQVSLSGHCDVGMLPQKSCLKSSMFIFTCLQIMHFLCSQSTDFITEPMPHPNPVGLIPLDMN